MLPWEKPLAKFGTNFQRYNYCFGCGSENPLGLKLSFQWDGNTATATFQVKENHQGWPGLMHGGLICAILDEAVGWAAYFKNIVGVTGRLDSRLKCPIPVGQTLKIAGTITKESRKLMEAEARIALEDGTEAAYATGILYILPQSQKPEA